MHNYNWYLLENRNDLTLRLFNICSNPDYERLFDNTDLADCTDESPLLINVEGKPEIIRAVEKSPEEWPGLLIRCTQPAETLLAHLRHILFIRFDKVRKGVLRYSLPVTASYFFPACSDEELSTWLGPIEAIAWYGGTWREKAEDSYHWYYRENLNASVIPYDGMLHLSEGQADRLRLQQAERFTYKKAKENNSCFSEVWRQLEAEVI